MVEFSDGALSDRCFFFSLVCRFFFLNLPLFWHSTGVQMLQCYVPASAKRNENSQAPVWFISGYRNTALSALKKKSVQ